MKRFGLVVGPVLFALVAFVPSGLHRLEGLGHRPAYAAAFALWLAVWWFTEAVPIGWTALIPLLGYPVLGVYGQGFWGDTKKSVEPFLDAYLLLFLGGMALGASMEHFNLHRRIALQIMVRIGASPKRLLLGLLVATAFISLWISNTATAVMMVPIGLAVVAQLEAREGRKLWNYGGALMLAVAWASNVGGIGTKIGTATNSIFAGFVAEKMQRDVGFLEYAAVGLPFVVLFIPIVWLALWTSGRVDAPKSAEGREVLEGQLRALGPMSAQEKRIAVVFVVTASLWIFADLIKPVFAQLLPFKFQGKHYEAAVALLAAAVLLALKVLPWGAIKRIPVSALLLLGGSFAMAAGLEGSGLSKWLGAQLQPLADLPLWAQFALGTTATIGLSAVASNTATVNLMLALLPRSLPLLATISMGASCDFALPAGTPPNAIVFGSGYVRLPTMMRTGILLDLAAALVLTLYGLTWVTQVLG